MPTIGALPVDFFELLRQPMKGTDQELANKTKGRRKIFGGLFIGARRRR
jgi:hypothetical protein